MGFEPFTCLNVNARRASHPAVPISDILTQIKKQFGLNMIVERKKLPINREVKTSLRTQLWFTGKYRFKDCNVYTNNTLGPKEIILEVFDLSIK